MMELYTAYARKHGFFKTLKYKKANRYRFAVLYACFPRTLRKVLLKYSTVLKDFGVKSFLSLTFYKLFGRRKLFFSGVSESLRKLNKGINIAVRPDDIYTSVLREGR
jgi:hypothetical protein